MLSVLTRDLLISEEHCVLKIIVYLIRTNNSVVTDQAYVDEYIYTYTLLYVPLALKPIDWQINSACVEKRMCYRHKLTG